MYHARRSGGGDDAAIADAGDTVAVRTQIQYNKVILTNRTAGPDKILDIMEERCGGQFDKIEDVITQEELAEHARIYKALAGFGIQSTNEKPRIIPEGAYSIRA